MKEHKNSPLKQKYLGMTLEILSASADASVFYKKESILPKYVSLAFPALAYLLFFGHLAADKIAIGYIKPFAAFLYPAAGLLAGIVSVLVNAGVILLCSMAGKTRKADFKKLMRGLSMSYGVSMLLALFGLLFKLITAWPSLLFGICAVLFSLCPLTVFCLKFFKDKPFFAYAAPTVCGIVQILLCNLFYRLQF